MSIQSCQCLYSRFKNGAPFRIAKTSTANSSNVLSTIDGWFRTNDEVTASKLKAKLLEWCTNSDVDLSTMIKRLENHCTFVMLSCGL